MDIEERAEKWANENTSCEAESLIAIAAYLAGSAQTQSDYVAHAAHERRSTTVDKRYLVDRTGE